MPGCCDISGRAFLWLWNVDAERRQALRPALVYYDKLELNGNPFSDYVSEAVSHEIVRRPPLFSSVRQ